MQIWSPLLGTMSPPLGLTPQLHKRRHISELAETGNSSSESTGLVFPEFMSALSGVCPPPTPPPAPADIPSTRWMELYPGEQRPKTL